MAVGQHDRQRPAKWRWAAGAVAFAALGVAACGVVLPLDGLDNGVCPADQKACERECVTLSSPAHGCASDSCTSCGIPHAQARCGTTGQCELAVCVGKFADCDQDPSNGCEIDTGFDVLNCGACKKSCDLPYAVAGCGNGVCAILDCNDGFADCDGIVGNGCETKLVPGEGCVPDAGAG